MTLISSPLHLNRIVGRIGMVLARHFSVVFSIIRLFPSTSQRTQVIDLLRSIQDLTLRVPGCLGCWISEEDYSPNRVRYAEQWESEEALHNHLRSELYLKVLSAMELSKRQPDIDFYHTSKREGFELVQAVREKAYPQVPPGSKDGART